MPSESMAASLDATMFWQMVLRLSTRLISSSGMVMSSRFSIKSKSKQCECIHVKHLATFEVIVVCPDLQFATSAPRPQTSPPPSNSLQIILLIMHMPKALQRIMSRLIMIYSNFLMDLWDFKTHTYSRAKLVQNKTCGLLWTSLMISRCWRLRSLLYEVDHLGSCVSPVSITSGSNEGCILICAAREISFPASASEYVI